MKDLLSSALVQRLLLKPSLFIMLQSQMVLDYFRKLCIYLGTYFIASFTISLRDKQHLNSYCEHKFNLYPLFAIIYSTLSDHYAASGSKQWHAVQQLCHCDVLNPQQEQNWE